MEQPMRCKTLTAIYRNEVKSPRTSCELDFSTHESISIHIMQSTERTIIINSTSEQSVNVMLSRLVDTFFSRTSWTMLLYAENHSISVA